MPEVKLQMVRWMEVRSALLVLWFFNKKGLHMAGLYFFVRDEPYYFSAFSEVSFCSFFSG